MGQISNEVEVIGYEQVPISKLKVADTNNRIEIPDKNALTTLRDSMRMNGITTPLVVNENYEIISGQLRYIVAKELGIEIVPVVKCRFKNKYHERVVSLLTDTTHNPLTDADRYNFIKKAIEEDGKTLQQIALDTGLSISTLSYWYNWGKSPEVVQKITKEADEETKQSIDKYFQMGIKKKHSVDKILESQQFSKDPEKALEVIKATDKLPLRVFEDMQKEIKYGLNVDVKKKVEIIQQPTEMIHLRIPKTLFDKFVLVLKKEKRDMMEVLLKLIEDYVKARDVI